MLLYERNPHVADQRGFHILEINGESDHVHILMEADTTTSLWNLQKCLKHKQHEKARKLYVAKPFLKNITGNLIFGRIVIFISSVSENSLHTIKTVYSESGETLMCPPDVGTLLRFCLIFIDAIQSVF